MIVKRTLEDRTGQDRTNYRGWKSNFGKCNSFSRVPPEFVRLVPHSSLVVDPEMEEVEVSFLRSNRKKKRQGVCPQRIDSCDECALLQCASSATARLLSTPLVRPNSDQPTWEKRENSQIPSYLLTPLILLSPYL